MVQPAAPCSVKAVLKRGALLAAVNWQVVLLQFAAESLFKSMLAVPLVGGAVLAILLVGPALRFETVTDWRTLGFDIAQALAERPAALGWFLVAVLVIVLGGSAALFLVKAGTVSVLVAAEMQAGAFERSPLHTSTLRQAEAFRIERYLEGCARLFPRYLRLGYALLAVYGGSAAVYLAGLYGWYRAPRSDSGLWLLAPLAWSAVLAGWITLVNFAYLLLQMVTAVEDCSLRAALGWVRKFLRAMGGRVAAVFFVVVLMALVATVLFFVLAAGVGLIAFVPVVGLVAFPLQAGTWFVRGLVFQWLGLTALCAYMRVYRTFRSGESFPASAPLSP